VNATGYDTIKQEPRMAIRVECYAGYRGDQEPLAFWLGERRLVVRAVVDRWFAPAQRWFKIDTEDGNTYVLRHDEASGDWEVAAYASTPSAGDRDPRHGLGAARPD
jgi:hypothetical protein